MPFNFPDFLEEEEGVEAEDEAEIVGTPSPKKLSHPSHTSHTSNPDHHHLRPGPTTGVREQEEEEEADEEEDTMNRIDHAPQREKALSGQR